MEVKQAGFCHAIALTGICVLSAVPFQNHFILVQFPLLLFQP